MCGRYSIIKLDKETEKRFNATVPKFTSNYNAAPSQKLPIIMNDKVGKIKLVRWGLIPSWADDEKIGYKLINTRAESLTTKPMFKRIAKKRCLVIADGFYEWKKAKEKIPFRITLKNNKQFAFAGLWEEWKSGSKKIRSFSIITCTPNPLVKRIHNRMPVVLSKSEEKEWLNPDTKPLKFLNAYPATQMKAYEVSTLVNSPKNNSKEVILQA